MGKITLDRTVDYLIHPHKCIIAMGSRGWIPLTDKQYVRLVYNSRMGKQLNLDNPVTFNEKIQWLKLYDHNPAYARMVDKYEAKRYVGELIGFSHIVPTLGIWDSVDDIDFDSLPQQFVIKCTHDSLSTCIVDDKTNADITSIKCSLKKHLKKN